MVRSDPFSLLGMDGSQMQTATHQEDFQIMSHQRVDPSESFQQPKEEPVELDLPSSSFTTGSLAYSSTSHQPVHRASNVANPDDGIDHTQASSRSQSQTYPSDLFNSCSSTDWSSQGTYSSLLLPPHCDTGSGHFVPSQRSPSSYRPTGSARPSSSDLAPPSAVNGHGAYASTSSRGGHFRRGFEIRDSSELAKLKSIEESIQCFWLVSEGKTSQLQRDLSAVASSVNSSALRQEQMSSQVNQILPLQVQITQKCVRAAEDRKVIFGRIKALEESTAAWQEEVNGKLETMHAELRTGMETMLSLASKTQKPSPAKAKNEPAATSSASKGQKRASPARKKASPANAKKAKLAPAPEEACEDAPASVTPAPDSPPAKGHQDLTQEWAQKQQTRYLQQRQQLPQQTERAQHQQQEQQIRQACPQFDGAYQQQNHFQSLSQPSGSISYPSTFEEVPLQARPRTATSYTHAPHQSLTVFEMPLGH